MQAGFSPANNSRALAIAAVITADALIRDRTADEIGQMAAFFTVLGDTMALLALDPRPNPCREDLRQESS